MDLYRVWYQNGSAPTSRLSLATCLEVIEYTERDNTDFLRAELATLTQEEVEWQAERLLPMVKLAIERNGET